MRGLRRGVDGVLIVDIGSDGNTLGSDVSIEEVVCVVLGSDMSIVDFSCDTLGSDVVSCLGDGTVCWAC